MTTSEYPAWGKTPHLEKPKCFKGQLVRYKGGCPDCLREPLKIVTAILKTSVKAAGNNHIIYDDEVEPVDCTKLGLRTA